MIVTVCEENHLPGLKVLDYSLRKHNKELPRKILITESITSFRDWEIRKIHSSKYAGIKSNPRFKAAWKKLEVFAIGGVENIVYFDSDLLCLDECSELFGTIPGNRNMWAAKDDGIKRATRYKRAKWPRLNSGVMVISAKLRGRRNYKKIMDIAISGISYDGGDQGAINEFLMLGNHTPAILPLRFNCLKRIYKKFPELWDLVKEDLVFLHFVGRKPWESNDPGFEELENIWWRYAIEDQRQSD